MTRVSDDLIPTSSGGPAVPVVEPAAASDDLAVADLYAAQYDDMVRLAFVITGSAEAAADAVQDAFVKLYRKWDGVRAPVPYLRRIVVNNCRTTLRRRGRERRALARERVPVVDLAADELGDALAALPHRQRAAIVLRFYGGCSEREIADALGCRPGTVGSLVHRGLASLREVIER